MIVWDNDYEFINELYNSVHDRYSVSIKKNWKYTRIPRAVWVYMTSNNTEIKKWYVIHHINYNIKDDNINNLKLLTIWEHNRIHSIDENHYMFRKWHSYWSKPKSEEHKKKIKYAHIKIAEKIKLDIMKIAFSFITQSTRMNEFLKKINRKSHKSIKRITGMNFSELKIFILNQRNYKFWIKIN